MDGNEGVEVLRERADAEGARRAADGCRRAVRQAEEEAVQPALGTRQPRRPSSKGAAGA